MKPFTRLLVAAPAALALALGAIAQDPAPKPAPPEKGPDEVPVPKLPPGVGQNEGARIEYEVGSQNHNFGRLTQGAVASHTFSLKAGGTEDLLISNVKPTCGCTVAQVLVENDEGEMVPYVLGDVIPKGRRVDLPATLHTKNKYGQANTRINIFSNDPRGTIQLGLTADIEAFFTLNPRFINFGQLQLGQVQTQQATITTARQAPVALELLEQALPNGVKVELEAINPDEQGKSSRWQVAVTVGPDLVEGNFARALIFQSDEPIPSEGGDDLPEGHSADDGHNHAQTPGSQFFQAQLTVSAQVVGPFSYAPNYLSMGLVRPGQVVTRTIRVECHDPEYSFTGRELQTELVGLPIPGGNGYQDWKQAQYFTTVVRPVADRNAVDVELRLEGMPEDAIGSFRGTLIVHLDHADKPEIALTITGVCRGGPTPARRVPPGGGE